MLTRPDPAVYAAFIGQLELRHVWLRAARIENLRGPETPDLNHVMVEARSEWESLLGGFRAFQSYKLRLDADAGDRYAELEVTFGVDYASAQPMSDVLFHLFAEVNLPVNTWPFLREYVSTTVGRMGWTPITLPAFKVGTGREEEARPRQEEPPKSSATKTKRRKPAKV